MADMARKGRGGKKIRGIWNGRAKLSMKQVRDIRVRYVTGRFTQDELADRFGVSQFAVSAIVRNKRYAE